MLAAGAGQRVAAVRRFNRFYTRQIGLLQVGILRSPFSLTEVRVLYELARRHRPTAVVLAQELGLDPGYLSRILRTFQERRWIEREASALDGRRRTLHLTAKGRRTFVQLDRRSSQEVAEMLDRFPPHDQRKPFNPCRPSNIC